MGSASPFESASLGPVTLRNRIIKAATFEGVMPRGAVTDELIAYHVAVARGGVGLTTLAYCAVSMGGRVSPHTLVFRDALVPDLVRLTDAVHAEGAAVAAQLGHAGLVAQARSRTNPTLAPSTRLSAPAKGLVRAATAPQLDEVVADFERAARVAESAGFDAIEIHLGHNYLLSSFFSPNLNRRRDELGGSIDARSQFPRRVVAAVRGAVSDHIAVYAKFNMDDGVPKGLHPDESLQIAQLLEADGHLDALELTGGSSLLNGMYFFRGDVPLREFAASQGSLVGVGVRLFGRRIFPTIPFEEAFFLPMARQFRAELSMPLILLGGINRLDTIESALGEGFELVAMARALLRDPDLVNQFAGGQRAEGRCTHCNQCLPTIYSGTRCVLVKEPAGAVSERTVVVTGSASGMGAATRVRLEADGQRVIGIDLRDAEVEADLSTAAGRAAAIEGVRSLAGPAVDGLVTWAGLSGLAKHTGSQLVSVNHFGTVDLLDGLRPLLAAGDRPAAVAISSNSTTCFPGVSQELVEACLDGDEDAARVVGDQVGSLGAYPATKTAVARWVRRHAPTETWAGAGITLNAVAPGAIETPLLQDSRDDPVIGQFVDAFPVPIGRTGRADEVAAFVQFLLGPDARFFCGSLLFVDGGTDALLRADDVPTSM